MSIPSFSTASVEAIAAVLGDTGSGLTGSEIAKYLAEARIDDPGEMTKRRRLEHALAARQEHDRCANNVIAFIQLVMSPVRHHHRVDWFEQKREELNRVLAFEGLCLGPDGKVARTVRVATHDEARKRANRLRHLLEQREVHAEVLRFCREELVHDNYFHAVLEASKSVAERIRTATGLQTDGGLLVNEALSTGDGTPHLAINTLRTESEQGEQRGFANLLRGLFGMFRNPTAHAPRITWVVTEQDALDILSLISLVHRRLDNAVAARRLSGKADP